MKAIVALSVILMTSLSWQLISAPKQATLSHAQQLNCLISKGTSPAKVTKLIQRRAFSKEQLAIAYDLAVQYQEQRAVEVATTAPGAPQALSNKDCATGVASGTAIAAGVGSLGAAGFCGAMAVMGGLSLVVFAPIAGVFAVVGVTAIALGGLGINKVCKRPSKYEMATQAYKHAQEITNILLQTMNVT
jgi:hypothetical protein